MTKILDNKIITTFNPKMLELRRGFIINGQYYLKENMQPIPFNFLTLDRPECTDSGKLNLLLDKVVRVYDCTTNASITPRYSNVVFDSQDERYTYTVFSVYNYSYILKIEESDTRCNIVAIREVFRTANSKVISLEDNGQDLIAYTDGLAAYTNLHIISKNDLSTKKSYRINSVDYSNNYVSDYTCIIRKNFIFKSGYGSSSFSYHYNDRDVYIEQKINDAAITSSGRNRLRFNGAWIDDEQGIIVMYPEATQTNGAANIKNIVQVTFDKENNEFKQQEIIPIINNQEEYFRTYNSISDVWFRTVKNKKYMFIYNRSVALKDNAKFIILEYKEQENEDAAIEKTFEMVKIIDLPNGCTGEIIYFDDENEFKFYGATRSHHTTAYSGLFSNIYCYQLDEDKLDLVRTLNIDEGEAREFGFDKERNLYVLWSDYSVSKYNDRIAANLNIKFENPLYEYEGENIETNLVVASTNLEGEFLEQEIKLEIKGNAVFKENGAKTLETVTSASNEKSIPITITGAGVLNIFPKIKV